MPTTFLVDDATNTPFTSGSAGVQVVVGTATSINGSPVGALAGLVGNFALDTSTNTLWACTASGTSGSAQWEQVLTDPSLYALINGSGGQVFNVADATQDSNAVNLSQLQQYGGGNFQGFGGNLNSDTTLTSIDWGYAFQLGASGITITLPTTNGNSGQAMWFYPAFATGSCTINCTGSGQFIFAPTCGLGSSNTSVTVNAGEWLCIMSRGSEEFDVVAGSWLNNHQTSQSVEFYAPVAVPAATANNQAVSYGQAFQLLSGAPPSSITLGNTLHTVAKFSITASGSVTLEPGSVVGQDITIYGGAYALTINSNVTSGSPYFLLPDESEVYSWTIPASGFAQGVRVDWDGTNWRARTFGQTVVDEASQANAAPQLSQLFIGNRKAVFTANGTWTVPSYVSTIWVSGCAAGGGGGGGGGSVGSTGYGGGGGGGGGGAGQPAIRTPFAVSAGDSLAVVIGGAGAGGAGGANTGTNGSNGADGGNSTLTNTTTSTLLLTLTGGSGGVGGGGQASTSAAIPAGSAGGTGGSGYPAGSYGTDGNYAGNGGAGASGPFGGGGGSGRAATSTASGEPAPSGGYGYGSGGGGGGGFYGPNAGAGGAGSAGSSGYMVIEW